MGVTSLPVPLVHLAVMFEGSTASGAERAYKKALNKLTEHLVDADVLGVVELKLTDKNKKIAAAAYEYKAVHRYANDDDEWGEIRFDFSAGTAQIVKLADGDFSRTNVFASKIVCQQGCFSPLLETQSQGISPLWIPRIFSEEWYPNCKNAV